MSIEITRFREFKKNSLIGLCNILMTNIGLEIRDAAVHEKDGKRWVGLPSRPYEKEVGSTGYSYIVKFLDKGKYAQFQKLALEVLEQHILRENIKEMPEDNLPF